MATRHEMAEEDPQASDDLSGLRLLPHERRAPASRAWMALVILFSITSVAIFSSWQMGLWSKEAQSTGPDSEAANGGRRETEQPAQPEERTTMVAAGGYLEAKRMAVILPQRDGLVAKVYVERGQRVRQGDVLLKLDSDMLEAEVAIAKAELASAAARLQRVEAGSREEEIEAASAEVRAANADLEDARHDLTRLEQLAHKNAATTTEIEDCRYREKSLAAKVEELEARERLLRKGNRPADFLEAQAEVERAEAALRQSQVSLRQSSLLAPFDGIATRVNLEPGEIVTLMNAQKGNAGIEIADVSELLVKVDVPETRIGKIALGSSAQVTVNALGSEPLQGVVVEIAPLADRQSNTVEVAIRILDPPTLLRPDMSARVAIHIEEPEDQHE